MYPSYPRYSMKGVHRDKFRHDTLMRVWDEFSDILTLYPKNETFHWKEPKVPHWDFWWKGGQHYNTVPDRETAELYQYKSEVSGWCVITGREDTRVVVIDLDPASMEVEPQTYYEYLQGLSPTSFVLQTPSGGVHLYYRIPDDKPIPKGSAGTLEKGVDVRGDGGQVVFIGGINYYEDGSHKGVPDGHKDTYRKVTGGEYHWLPEMSESLYNLLLVTKTKHTSSSPTKERDINALTQERLQAHFAQSLDKRVAVTIEAVAKVLDSRTDKWDNQTWLQIWMAAHHGSDGSPVVRDFIIAHRNLVWVDGDDGKMAFIERWDTHEHQTDGYTIASLFWLAREHGWLTHTGYEIRNDRMEKINVKYISEWLDTLDSIPDRLLLMSQTGSGKTYAIKQLYHQLDSPKTVIFVPTRKLATELAMTLKNVHGLPVTLYRETETGEIIDTEALVTAKILVTTLQTFATKVRVPMSEYGLVYVEESDQLLAQFALGGGGWRASHVDDQQARKGYAKIREAVEKSGVVWFVDATMSKVTQTVVENMYDGHVRIVYNKRVSDKAPVIMLSDKETAYQKMLEALAGGKKVVVCADTASEAEKAQEIAETVGILKNKKSIVITRSTENRREVHQFMEDVNLWADEYDLICYNSVMASGVSIDKVTPDVVIQIATYLSPRVNIQILNRFRSQQTVYCYYNSVDNLYSNTAQEILEEVEYRASVEAMLINMAVATRHDDAALRQQVAAIAIADEHQQRRLPRDFYEGLLEGDGRELYWEQSSQMYRKLKTAIDKVKEIRKAQAEYISQTWREIPPIDERRPALPEYELIDIARGETHAWIERTLRGNIPENVPDSEIYDIVNSFHRYGFILTAFVKQSIALKNAERYLADKGRSLLNLSNNVTKIRLLTVLAKLYANIDEVLSPETVALRADSFMNSLILAKERYDAVINRKSQKFDAVYNKNETNAERAIAFAKILLSTIGLKQRVKRVKQQGETIYHYHIANLEDARKFLNWRNADDEMFKPTMMFDDTPIVNAIAQRANAYEIYKTLSREEQDKVFSLVDDLNDFNTAVSVVHDGGDEWI